MTFDIDSAITFNQPTGRQAPEPIRQRTEPFRRAGGADFAKLNYDYGGDDIEADVRYDTNSMDPSEYIETGNFVSPKTMMDTGHGPYHSPLIDAVTTAEAAKPEEERMMDDIAAEASAAKILRKKLGASSMNLPEVMNQGKVADIISSIHGLEPNDITKLAPLTQLYADAVARRMDAGMSFQDAFQDALGGHAYPYDIA